MLAILYIITAALVLTGFAPLKIVGVFFGMCYLPGLTLFSIIKKEKLISYEDETLPPCWVNRGIKQIKKEYHNL